MIAVQINTKRTYLEEILCLYLARTHLGLPVMLLTRPECHCSQVPSNLGCAA